MKSREDAVQVYLLLARWRRGAPTDRSAARRHRPRVVAGRHAPGRRECVARRDRRSGPQGSAGWPRRPSPDRPPPSDYRFVDRLDYMLNGDGFTYDQIDHLWLVDVATGDDDPPDGRPDRRTRTGLVAGRDAHRVLGESRQGSGPDVPLRPVHRGRRHARRDRDHGRPEVRLRPADLAAGRQVDRGARPPDPDERRIAQRHLAVRRGRLGRARRRRSEPVRGARPDARVRDEQRRHDRRRDPAHPVGRRRVADLHRADPGLVRAVPDRDRTTAASSGSRTTSTTSPAGTASPARRSTGDCDSPTCARRRPTRRTSIGWTVARTRAA